MFSIGDQVVNTIGLAARFESTAEITLDELRIELTYPLHADADRVLIIHVIGSRPGVRNTRWTVAAGEAFGMAAHMEAATGQSGRVLSRAVAASGGVRLAAVSIRGSGDLPGLKCRVGGVHETWSSRIWVTTARWSHLSSLYEIADDEARYRHGWTDDQVQPVAVPQTLHRAGADPVIGAVDQLCFIGFDIRSRVPVAAIVIYRPGDGGYHVGGTVARQHRRRGYGREALSLICALAHHHLGIATLAAGCDASHEAGCKWLASCGFAPVPGPARHALPNGRVVEARWWHHRGGNGQRHCRMPST